MAEEVNAAQCKITIRYHRPAQSFAQKTESRTKIQSALPKDLDAQVFGYFDLLESKAADWDVKQIHCAITKRGYRSGQIASAREWKNGRD